MLLSLSAQPWPADDDVQFDIPPLPVQKHAHRAAGRRGGDGTDQHARRIGRLTIDRGDDIARPQPGALARPVALHGGDPDADIAVPIGVRHLLQRRAEPAALDMPLVAQLGHDPAGDLGRDGEADADGGAGRRGDGGIDAHHLALHVEHRTAGVAGVDRRVDLQEIVERARADIAPARRDDAGGDRAAEAERVAGAHHPVAHLDRAAVAPADIGQRGRRGHLDQRHVGQIVHADHLGRQVGAVGQADHDLVGAADHVIVRDDIAGRVDDEAGAGALHALLARLESLTEQLLELGRQIGQRVLAGHRLGGADAHHGGSHALDQRREAVRPIGLGGPGTGGNGERQQRARQRQQTDPARHARCREPDAGRIDTHQAAPLTVGMGGVLEMDAREPASKITCSACPSFKVARGSRFRAPRSQGRRVWGRVFRPPARGPRSWMSARAGMTTEETSGGIQM